MSSLGCRVVSGRKRGFTLIELLVIIGIILILIALLFPALATVEDRANKAKCLNNCRQIAVAAVNLFGELGDKMPYRDGPHGCTDWGAAAEQLLPYLKNITDVFDCPANARPVDYPNCDMPNYPGKYTEYEINGYLCACVGGNHPQRKQNMITDYSLAAYAYDYPYDWRDNNRAHGGTFAADGTSWRARRRDGVNCAYLDGHAAWLPDCEMGELEGADPGNPMKFYLRGHVVRELSP